MTTLGPNYCNGPLGSVGLNLIWPNEGPSLATESKKVRLFLTSPPIDKLKLREFPLTKSKNIAKSFYLPLTDGIAGLIPFFSCSLWYFSQYSEKGVQCTMYTVHTLSILRMNNNTKASFVGNKVFQNFEDLRQCLLFGKLSKS